MDRLLSEQAVIDYLIANVSHDDYGDELDADELREMWTERINKIPSTELHLVNGSQGLVKEFNKDYALRSIEQYIDKFDCIDVNFLDGLKTAMQLIRELTSAEPQIIRCKDCSKREICRTSTVWAVAPSDDWFCGDAERKE